jgi:hypothetical protein
VNRGRLLHRLLVLLVLLIVGGCQAPAPSAVPNPPTPDIEGTVRAQVQATISAVRVLPSATATSRLSPSVQTVAAIAPTAAALATLGAVVDSTSTAIALAEPTSIPMPKLPVRRDASDASPAYTITKITDRETNDCRRRYLVEIRLTNDSRDGVVAAMRDTVQWSLASLSDAKTITVWGFTSIQPSWIGQAQASTDGLDWSGTKADDGKIDVTFAPLSGKGDRLRFDR